MSWFSKKPKSRQDKTRLERGKAFSALDAYYQNITYGTAEDCGEWIDPFRILDHFRKTHWKGCEPGEFIPMLLLYLKIRGGRVKRSGKGLYVTEWPESRVKHRCRGLDTSGLHVPRDPRKVRSLPYDSRIAKALKQWGL